MGFFQKIKNAVAGEEPKKVRIPLPADVAREIKGFDHSKTWVCKCGANLRIRARDPRAEGPSNYHPRIPSGDLNWNGLAVERGWQVDPVTCPACWRGVSVAEYKRQRG